MTFRRRLTGAVLWLSLGLLGLTGGIVFLGTQAALRKNLDDSLLAIARAELASALDGPGGKVHVHDEDPVPLSASTTEGYEKFALIRSESGSVVAHTRNLPHAPTFALERSRERLAWRGQANFGDIQHGGEELRALYYPFADRRGQRFVTVCAVSKHPLLEAQRTVFLTLFSALGLCALAAWLASGWLARRLTGPLQEIEAQARGVEESRLFARLPAVSEDAELQAVTESLNAMLGRLESSFDQQKQFLLDASHELRTPLANLRGTIEVTLRRPREAEDYRKTLAQCLPEVERLGSLVGDLLTLSRAEQGKAALVLAPCDLAVLAEESVVAHAGRAVERDVTLRRTGLAALPLDGDALRLRQALDNLLDNALRYAPPGSTVTVTVFERGFVVRDDGPGIMESDIPHVFTRFWRGDKSRSRETGGLGLGLAIVKAIVEAHGGTILAESPVGGGTSFIARF